MVLGERLRDLADVHREEEERDEQCRDGRLRITDDLPHRAPAEQQDLGHGATALAAASSSSLGLVRVLGSGTLEAPPGRLQEDVVQRRPRNRDRARPRRRPRPAGARSPRSRPRRSRRDSASASCSAITRSRPGSSPITCWVRSASAPCELDRDHVLADLGLQALGRPLGDDLAGIDDRQPLAELVGLLQVLGGEEDRGAASR